MWLFAILVAVPIIEIALFIQVGGAIGMWPTLAIVILTAFAGTILLRAQGTATLHKLQNSMVEGQNPITPMAHGALILIAGVLLLTPGFFTDAFGLSLMIPPVRAAFIKAGAARFAGRSSVIFTQGQQRSRASGTQSARPDIVDGDFTVENETDPKAKGNSGWTRPNTD